ncbi:DUF3987 domain-containing protein [Novosphingobium sp.]|uniref:DUF3987 domain-containing protein n=1 Tax=Novosphingobium sp. TaxID=1874826 RepID=UPI0035B29D66
MRGVQFDPELARPLFASLDQIHLVMISPVGPGVHGKDFGQDVETALVEAAKANGNGFNIYWTVNRVAPGSHKKPGKRDIRAARFVHVDIDPPKSGGAFDKGEITAALQGIACPPSFVIDSGGGLQAFWRLEDPCANLASIEAINLQVRDWFEADACQNIDRLMRVPGSVNYPDSRKAARGRKACLARWAAPDEGVVYAPEDLAASFPQARSPDRAQARAPLALPADMPLLTPEDLGLGFLDPLRLAIATPPGEDRSGDGLAAARLMANVGLTDAQVMGVLLNPANAVAAHFLDQRDPRRAAARALQLVRRDSPSEGETLHASIMSDADFARFVANEKAKVRRVMVPATLQGDDRDEVDEPTPTIGTPGWLRDLGDGALAQFVAHTCASAPSPQPWLTLGAGLAMFGAAAGRRYAGPTNLRTNLYAIGVADSGGGKDHPLRASTRLMIAAGLADHIGSSKIASGAGLLTAITANPSIYFPLDEVGFLIASAADRKRAPRHLTEIIDNLTEFYSLADSTFLGIAYANAKERPREVIEQPCLCLFGVTTPGVFWGALSTDNVIDGSLARMLIFESENHYPDPQHQLASNEPPADLVELVKSVAQGADGSSPFPLGNAAAAIPKPYTVPYATPQAEARARAMREEQIDMLRRYQGTHLTGIIARLAENAAKLALIKAITDNPGTPAITTADLDWGMGVARHSVQTLMQAVRERVADNEYEATVKKVHKVIADAGSAGIDGKALSRKTQTVDRRKRIEIIAHLEEAGMIRVMEMARAEGARGRTKRIYFDTE